MLKVKKYGINNVIDSLRKICNHYLSDSYDLRLTEQSAMNSIESAEPYLKMEECCSNVEFMAKYALF